MKRCIIALDLSKINKVVFPKKIVYLNEMTIVKGSAVFHENLANATFISSNEVKDVVEMLCTKWYSDLRFVLESGDTYKIPFHARSGIPEAISVKEVEINIGVNRDDLIDRDLLKEITRRECLA